MFGLVDVVQAVVGVEASAVMGLMTLSSQPCPNRKSHRPQMMMMSPLW